MRSLGRPDYLFVGVALVSAAVLVWLGLGLTFFSDEWAFIESTFSSDLATWLAPHNEHWTTLARLLYRAILETAGLRSYLPYLAVLVALHVLVATLVNVLVRRSSGPWPALGVGTVILLFGSGFENLYWAFQITFVGSMATGLLAMLVFDSRPLTNRRIVTGSGLLLASLATSAIGPVLLLAVAVELLLDRTRRHALRGLVLPVAVYAAWFVAVGRIWVVAREGVFRLGGPEDVPPVVAGGLAAAAGALTGVGTGLGAVVIVIAALVAAGDWIRRRRVRLAPRAAGCLAAATALYGLIAISRAFVGPEVIDYTRYTYISGTLLAVGLAAQIGRPSLDSTASRRAWLFGGSLVFVLALTWNVRLLIAGRALFEERAERTRALVTVALERPLPGTTDPTRSLVLVPSPNVLEQIVARYGSPLTDSIVPWAVPPIRDSVLESARRTLAEGAEIPLPEDAE